MPTPEARIQAHSPELLNPYARVRLGGDEPAICGLIGLAPDINGNNAQVGLVLVDVGFKTKAGGYGPYDLDGSGEKRTFTKPYVLVSRKETEDGPRTYFYEVEPGEEIPLGRNTEAATALGYTAKTEISREHAKLVINRDGSSLVEDVGSKNGTSVRGTIDRPLGEILGPTESKFNYTININRDVSRAGKGHLLFPKELELGWGHGMVGNRPKIVRDTPINGGAYPVGGADGEILIIDDKKYPKELNEAYDTVIEALSKKPDDIVATSGLKKLLGRKPKTELLTETERTFETIRKEVAGILKYDLKATRAIATPSQEVPLGDYIKAGVGICRTQGVLSAYVIERLIDEGKLEGHVSVDRNQIEVDDTTSGHAWARFTDKTGQVYIIDPAQRFAGTLEKANNNPDKWDYRRTEDLVSQLLKGTTRQ